MRKPIGIVAVKEILKNLEIRISQARCAMPCENTLCNLEGEYESWDNELERLENLEKLNRGV